VNIAPLFTARAAFADPAAGALWTIPLNRVLVETAVASTEWTPVATHTGLSSGIRLYRPSSVTAQCRTPEATRTSFREGGVALTAYDGGVVRLSVPKGFVADRQYATLRAALAAVAGYHRS
jgi:hypothetical protein